MKAKKYTCQKCKEPCGTIRLADSKLWICDKCYFKPDKPNESETKKRN